MRSAVRNPIPTTIVTGFLGSGKTTLISEWLRHPDYAHCAVIVNEASHLGIDNVTLSGATDVVELTNGCFCCVARSSIGIAFRNVLLRAASRTDQPLNHLFIETSGLASPSDILAEMARDGLIVDRFKPATVVAVVDASNGLQTIVRFEEARRQIRLADHIALTKLDMASSPMAPLRHELAGLNAQARLDLERAPPTVDSLPRSIYEKRRRQFMAVPAADAAHSARSYLIERPLRSDTVTAFFEHLAHAFGDKILRLKGLLAIEENQAMIALIHGVQGLYYPVQWLSGRSADRGGFPLVIIPFGIQPEALDAAVMRFTGACTTSVFSP
jgi:G3E family GTPase